MDIGDIISINCLLIWSSRKWYSHAGNGAFDCCDNLSGGFLIVLWSVRIFWLLRFGCVVDLDLLCRVPFWSWRVVELPRCFLLAHSSRERTSLCLGVLVGGRYGCNLVNLVCLGWGRNNGVRLRCLLIGSVIRIAWILGRYRLLLLLCVFSFSF